MFEGIILIQRHTNHRPYTHKVYDTKIQYIINMYIYILHYNIIYIYF